MKKLFLATAFALAGVASFAGTGKLKAVKKHASKPHFIIHTTCGVDLYLSYTPGMCTTCVVNDEMCGTHMVDEWLNCPCQN